MYAVVGVGALCISSSVAAVMMNKKDEEVAVPAEQPEETIEKEEVEETGIAPEQPPPPPSEPAQKQLTTPNSMRSASSVWGDRGLNYQLKDCGNSMIDSSAGWCTSRNVIGQWIQLDNGKVGSISGVITQGRKMRGSGSNRSRLSTRMSQVLGGTSMVKHSQEMLIKTQRLRPLSVNPYEHGIYVSTLKRGIVIFPCVLT